MKRIISFIRKIGNLIANLIFEEYEDEDESMDDAVLTDEQQAKLNYLNIEYNKLLDVVENQIEMMNYSYITKQIDGISYKTKQEEITNVLSEIKDKYIKSRNYICCNA